MTVDEIRAQSPFPWKASVNALNGHVRLLDATGREVPIFSMTEFCAAVTLHIVNQPAPQSKAA